MSHWPLPLKIVLGLLGLGAAALVAVLAKFWGANPEHADRFLIVIGAGWAAWVRRPDLAALPLKPLSVGWLLLLTGAAAFPVGWFLQAQVAPKPVVIWWLAIAWLAAASGLTLVVAGWAHLRVLAFPLLFLLFACPIPNRILVPLQDKLQRMTTTAAAAVLPVLGVPIEREGFVLRLPGGDLGVAEACSGVRSVTALTAIAAFVAFLKNFSPLRGLTLLGLSVPVIAAVNAFRVVLSGLIQEWFGSRYIQGDWHEALGIGMVFIGLGLVVLLANWLDPNREESPQVASAEPTETPPVPVPMLAMVILVLSVVATTASQFVGEKVEQVTVATAPIEQIPLQLGHWKGQDLEIDAFITETLTYDKAVLRQYRNDLGHAMDVWVIFWSSQNMVKGYHHPDICLGNSGNIVRERERVPMAVANQAEVDVTVREFVNKKNKQQRLFILYWTQEGPHVWTDEDEQAAMLTGDSHRWLSDRLFGTPDVNETGRLVVLISTSMYGDGALIRKEAMGFTRLLADALYDVCPWARPMPNPQDSTK